ncbi:hypothetical protein JCM3765_002043 [Sporobolomyces pararoseus]
MPPKKKKNEEEQKQLVSLVPSDPSKLLVELLSTQHIGLVPLEIGCTSQLQGLRDFLNNALDKCDLDKHREIDVKHVEALTGSLSSYGLSSYDFPVHLAVNPNRENSETFPTPSSVLGFLRTRSRSKEFEPISTNEVQQLGLIALDGYHRLAALEKLVAESEEAGETGEVEEGSHPLVLWALVYSDKTFSEPVLLDELVHGKNRRNSFATLAASSSPFALFAFVSRLRTGGGMGRTLVLSEKKLQSAFYYFSASRSSVELAREATKSPLVNKLLEGRGLDPQISWLSAFQAYTSVLYIAIADSLQTFDSLDPTGSLIDVELYPFLSKVLLNLKAQNPLHLQDHDPVQDEYSTEEENAFQQLRVEQCSKLGKNLEEHVDKILLRDRKYVQVGDVTAYFKGVSGSSSLNFEVASRVVRKLKALATRLQDSAWIEKITGQFDKDIFLWNDFTCVSSRSQASTPILRSIGLLQSLLFEPLVQVLVALLQLTRNDSSLSLHKGDWLDLEPVIYELLFPHQATSLLKDARPSFLVAKSWDLDEEYSSGYQSFLSLSYLLREDILVEILSARARQQYQFSEDERQQLFEFTVAEELRSTPQAAVIRKYLHLVPFAIDAKRSLVPFTSLRDERPTQFTLFERGNSFALKSLSTSFLLYFADLDRSDDRARIQSSGIFAKADDAYTEYRLEEEEPNESEDGQPRKSLSAPEGLSEAVLSVISSDVPLGGTYAAIEQALSKLTSLNPPASPSPAPRSSPANSPRQPSPDAAAPAPAANKSAPAPVVPAKRSRTKSKDQQPPPPSSSSSSSESSDSSDSDSSDWKASANKRKRAKNSEGRKAGESGKRLNKGTSKGAKGDKGVGGKTRSDESDEDGEEEEEEEEEEEVSTNGEQSEGEAGKEMEVDGEGDSNNQPRKSSRQNLSPRTSEIEIVSIDGQPLNQNVSAKVWDKPRRAATFSQQLAQYLDTTVDKIVTMFRRSGAYQPIGDTINDQDFNLHAFKTSFDEWFDAQNNFAKDTLPLPYPPSDHLISISIFTFVRFYVETKLAALSVEKLWVPGNFWYDLHTCIKQDPEE